MAARPFIQWWYSVISVIDFLIVIASISKLLHSWLFIDPSEHHYTTQTLKFNFFFSRSSTMLNNVFKKSKPGRCDLIPSSKVSHFNFHFRYLSPVFEWSLLSLKIAVFYSRGWKSPSEENGGKWILHKIIKSCQEVVNHPCFKRRTNLSW